MSYTNSANRAFLLRQGGPAEAAVWDIQRLESELAASRDRCRWVSVRERLPDESKRGTSYPCQYHYRHSPNQVFIHEQPWGGTHWWVTPELIVTKWFDLPAPDAEVKDDE